MRNILKRTICVAFAALYLISLTPYAKTIMIERPKIKNYVKMEEYPKPAYIEVDRGYEPPEEIDIPSEEISTIDDPLLDAHVVTDVKVTYYCCERYSHICGNGDGLTATGDIATPYVSVAVDPKLIPLGSNVAYDYGDGELHYGVANDVGGSIKQKHIDVCVTTHKEALDLDDGHRYATVYWWD